MRIHLRHPERNTDSSSRFIEFNNFSYYPQDFVLGFGYGNDCPFTFRSVTRQTVSA